MLIQWHLNVYKKYTSFCIAVNADSIQTGILLAPIRVELDHDIFGHEIGIVKDREHLNARPADVVLDFGDMIADLKLQMNSWFNLSTTTLSVGEDSAEIEISRGADRIWPDGDMARGICSMVM